MKLNKLDENSSLEDFGLTEEDLELTDWDPAEDFASIEGMRGFLELTFSDHNIMLMLDAINAVARARGNDRIARRADSLEGKNPSREVINQMLKDIGFQWDGKTVISLE